MNVYKLIEKIYYDLDFSRQTFNVGEPNEFHIFTKEGKNIFFNFDIKDSSKDVKIHLPRKTYIIKNQNISGGDHIEILEYVLKVEI